MSYVFLVLVFLVTLSFALFFTAAGGPTDSQGEFALMIGVFLSLLIAVLSILCLAVKFLKDLRAGYRMGKNQGGTIHKNEK